MKRHPRRYVLDPQHLFNKYLLTNCMNERIVQQESQSRTFGGIEDFKKKVDFKLCLEVGTGVFQVDEGGWTYLVYFTIVETRVWGLYIVRFGPISGFTQQGSEGEGVWSHSEENEGI